MNTNDISVVVQGPIYGMPNDSYKEQYTFQCLKSIRKYLPGAEIVLSTWKGSNVTGLDYDILVENDDPGTIPMFLNGILRNNNTNRMLISTLNGVKKATKKYIIRIRTDMYFIGNDFLKYFGMYNKYTSEKILNERVITLSAINPHRQGKYPFALSDWFYYGLKEDIINIYDIPLIKETELKGQVVDGYYRWEDNIIAEQYILVSFLRKYRDIKFKFMWDLSNNAIEVSEKLIANNFLLLTSKLAQVNSFKDPNKKYVMKGFQSLDCYTHNEWKVLYNKYGNGDIFIIPSIKDWVYLFLYNLRFFIQYKMPWIYKKIKKLNKSFFIALGSI